MDNLLNIACERFRSIAWDTLQANSKIITGGALLQDAGAGSVSVGMLSELCALGHCDVFWSHSWSDDGQQKWQAVCDWATEFQQQDGRPPTFWLDKVCINQTSIVDDLRCLPVFLAGCNSLLVTSGSAYTSRLWCALELFVYFAMTQAHDENRRLPTVLLLGESAEAKNTVRLQWLGFDVQWCDCYAAGDKLRILAVIDLIEGGMTGFNEYMRSLASTVLGDTDVVSGAASSTSGDESQEV